MSLAYDEDTERAVLGAILISGKVIEGVLSMGLRPEHFYAEHHGRVFTAMMAVHERGEPVDSITTRIEAVKLNTNGATPEKVASFINVLAVGVPAAANVRHYATRVMDLASWRVRHQASLRMADAAEKRDEQGFSLAQGELVDGVRERRTYSYSPEAWADEIAKFFEDPGEERGVPLPFHDLNVAMGGGLLPGELFVLAGWTGHGKSIFADMCLDLAADRGYRCHCYMTEMTAALRGLRYVTRRTGVSFMDLRRRKLRDDQMRKVLAELGRVNYGVSVVADWDIDDVVRDALRARYDFVVVDLIHGFGYEDERGLDRLSKAMQRLARVSTTLDGFAGTAVLAVAHLNEGQMTGSKSPKRPQPGMHSIKGGSSLKQDADFVGFVWLQDDELGVPTTEGFIYTPKARSGEPARVPVVLNSRRFRFEVRDDT